MMLPALIIDHVGLCYFFDLSRAFEVSVKIQLIDKTELSTILPLLHEHNPEIPMETLRDRLDVMIELGYECAGIYDGEELIGICGIWTLCKYYVGKHLEPDNVYIRPEYRSNGVGRQLCEWLKKLAEARGCEAIELNCYLSNGPGRAFWEQNGYHEIGRHYQMKVSEAGA